MRQYLDALQQVRDSGVQKGDRTGTGTTEVFGVQARYDLADGFPAVTTKKLYFNSVAHELLWFLKGTGNMELQLDRRLANKRIYPAVDLVASSTRRDDLLQDTATQQRMWSVRKVLSEMNPIEAMENVKNLMLRTQNNEEFFAEVNS